ncbi:MAG: hypothetical protein HPAVJP_2590 [Candidatus Hepatoplasma vulgare]|nr:MAG: hypothetical protein HPAVJP_2590 [Candidatus Hepatoplasma sp.]
MPSRKTIIGSKALLISAIGEHEFATQIFDFTKIREIRADLDALEVKILTTFDDSFYRVFKINLENSEDKEKFEEGKKVLIKFYNDLLNASMRFSKEEIEQLSKNIKERQNEKQSRKQIK